MYSIDVAAIGAKAEAEAKKWAEWHRKNLQQRELEVAGKLTKEPMRDPPVRARGDGGLTDEPMRDPSVRARGGALRHKAPPPPPRHKAPPVDGGGLTEDERLKHESLARSASRQRPIAVFPKALTEVEHSRQSAAVGATWAVEAAVGAMNPEPIAAQPQPK